MDERKKLCVVFDIDETLIHFVSKTYKSLWEGLDPQIKNNLRAVEYNNNIIILRPHIQELFNFFKQTPNIRVGLWTYSEREYSEDIANVLKKELQLPDDFFLFTWGAEDMDVSEDSEEIELPKDLRKVYRTFTNFNKFNTFLVDDLYGNLKHEVNVQNCILIQPFAPFGTSKVRVNIGPEELLMSVNNEEFIGLIDICKKVLKDILGCDVEDINEAFTTDPVFTEKRIKRMGLLSLLKTYAVQFIKMLTLGQPRETPNFIMVQPQNYLPFKKGGFKSHYKNYKNKITRKKRKYLK